MSTFTRKEYKDTAGDTTLSTTINNSITTPIIIASGTGWPTGASYPFFIQIESELILCDSRSGTSITANASGRGYNGTTAASHTSGVTVKHVFAAYDADEANYVVAETVGKVTTSGDLLVSDGANSFDRLGITNNRLLGVSSSTLQYLQANSSMIATDAVTAAAIAAGAVGTSELAADGVTYAKIQNISATDLFLGRDTAGAGDAEELTVGGGLEFTGSGGIQRSALSGDISATAGSGTTAIGAGKVTQAMHATGLRALNVATSAPTGADGDLWYDTDDELLFAYNGTVWVCITDKAAEVATSETTTSASYTDLTTSGPAVSVITGTKALVTIGCWCANSVDYKGALMSFAVSGATTVAASDAHAIGTYIQSNLYTAVSKRFYVTGLTAGTNTFTSKYKRDVSDTAAFHDRHISVVGVP